METREELSIPSSAQTAPPGDIVAECGIARLGDRLIALILDTALFAAFFAVTGMWTASQ